MAQKRLDFPLLVYTIIVAILLAVTMQSSIELFLTETYNPNYYIYQALLYGLAGFIVIKNRNKIPYDGFMKYIWGFCALCFFVSLIRLDSISIRRISAVFFNTFIIPFAILNGKWLGSRLTSLKDQDLYILVLLIPVFYAIYLLRIYSTETWYDPDAIFCVVVFFPFVFFYKRDWLSIVFILIFVIISLSSAKRSILVFMALSLLIYFFYILFFNSENKRKSIINKIFLLSIIVLGAFYIATNEKSGLMHSIERVERIGGMTSDNGRNTIYANVASSIYESSVVSLLFGHGHMAVKNDLGMGAHNDLLEIAYDYGIIAALLYVLILLRLIITTWQLFRKKKYLSAMRVGICVSSIIILGMLNCIVTRTILEYSMFFALGCAQGMENDFSLNK